MAKTDSEDVEKGGPKAVFCSLIAASLRETESTGNYSCANPIVAVCLRGTSCKHLI
jgi:hypothetical protein